MSVIWMCGNLLSEWFAFAQATSSRMEIITCQLSHCVQCGSELQSLPVFEAFLGKFAQIAEVSVQEKTCPSCSARYSPQCVTLNRVEKKRGPGRPVSQQAL